MKAILLSNLYDYYRHTANKDGSGSFYGLFTEIAGKTLSVEQGIFSIFMNIGIYASAIAMVVSAATYAIYCRNNTPRAAEIKSWIVRVFVISLLIFCVTSIVVLVQNLALVY